MTDEPVSRSEFAAFCAETRVRLERIESTLAQMNALLLERSGDQVRFRNLEERVDKLESALEGAAKKVDRIWLGAGGVVAVIEVLRWLPGGTLARIFGG